MGKLAVGVFGVPGVGKSTLLSAHMSSTPVDRHVSGSAVIRSVIAPHTVRDMDEWSAERQAAVRAAAIRLLRGELAQTPGLLLVDGHFTLRSRTTGALTGVVTPEDKTFYGALVLIDGSPEQVHAHCLQDARSRHGGSLRLIAEHLDQERLQAQRTVSEMQVPFTTISAETLPGRLRELDQFLHSLRVQTSC